MAVFEFVIWDMDGVLVDSERHWDTKEDFFLARALDNWNKFDESRLIGRSLPDIYKMLREEMNLQMSYDEYREQYDATAKYIYSTKAELMPNALKTLEELSQAGIIQALVSSSTHRWIGYAIEQFGIKQYFTEIISSDDVDGKGKPAPDIYEYACKKLRASKNKILVVEDSVPGIQAAKNAGLIVAGYTGAQHGQHPVGADVEIDNLSQIPDLVKSGIR